jgi:hypothetical protein
MQKDEPMEKLRGIRKFTLFEKAFTKNSALDNRPNFF